MKIVNTMELSKDIVNGFIECLSRAMGQSGFTDADKKNTQTEIEKYLSRILHEVSYGFTLDETLEYQGTDIMEIDNQSILCLHDIAANM